MLFGGSLVSWTVFSSWLTSQWLLASGPAPCQKSRQMDFCWNVVCLGLQIISYSRGRIGYMNIEKLLSCILCLLFLTYFCHVTILLCWISPKPCIDTNRLPVHYYFFFYQSKLYIYTSLYLIVCSFTPFLPHHLTLNYRFKDQL